MTDYVYIAPKSFIVKRKDNLIGLLVGIIKGIGLMPEFFESSIKAILNNWLNLSILYVGIALSFFFMVLLISPITNFNFIAFPMDFGAEFTILKMPSMRVPGLPYGLPAFPSIILAILYTFFILFPLFLLIRGVCLSLKQNAWSISDLLKMTTTLRIFQIIGTVSYSYFGIFFVSSLFIIAYRSNKIGIMGYSGIIVFLLLMGLLAIRWSNIFGIMACEDTFF